MERRPRCTNRSIIAPATAAAPKVSPHRPKGLFEVTITRRPLIARRHQLEEDVGGLGFEGDVADLVDNKRRHATSLLRQRAGLLGSQSRTNSTPRYERGRSQQGGTPSLITVAA